MDIAESLLALQRRLSEHERLVYGPAAANFRRLLCSPAGRRLSRFVLRGTRLTAAELQELDEVRPDLQLLYVPPTEARYIG